MKQNDTLLHAYLVGTDGPVAKIVVTNPNPASLRERKYWPIVEEVDVAELYDLMMEGDSISYYKRM